jgi:hypothetical protein
VQGHWLRLHACVRARQNNNSVATWQGTWA